MKEATNSALDALARRYVSSQTDPSYRFRLRQVTRFGLEPVVGELTNVGVRALFAVGQNSEELTAALLSEDDLSILRHSPDSLDPFIGHAGGGHRVTPSQLPADLLGGAVVQALIRGLPLEEATIRSLLAEGLDDLKRAAAGSPVTCRTIYGLTAVSLEPDTEINTPWGQLRRAPEVDWERWIGHAGPTCTALFVRTDPTNVVISRDPEPPIDIEAQDLDEAVRNQRAVTALLPLACVLGSSDDKLAAPAIMWQMGTVSFAPPTGYSHGMSFGGFKQCPDLSGRAADVEHWARIVDQEHHPGIDVATHRVVSALAVRQDPADALIDAVTAWESLVGTDSETTFRVTASLTLLLEPDPAKRATYRRELGRIYDRRSRVVHGETVDAGKVAAASEEAIRIAARALRESYGRGKPWLALSSTERSNKLLLGDDQR